MKNIKKQYNVALLSAMPEEIGSTISKLKDLKITKYGELKIYSGLYYIEAESVTIKIFTAWSGWGKVNATHAATRILNEADSHESTIDLFLFTGVAGSADPKLKQWDIVVPDYFVQHDMDARPIFDQFIIPGLNSSHIKIDNGLQKWAIDSINEFTQSSKLKNFGKVHSGLIATGDKFISSREDMELLLNFFPDLKAVEMEGCAVGQILLIESIPFLAIRVISDQADDCAGQTFEEFISEYKYNSWKLIESVLIKISTYNKNNIK